MILELVLASSNSNKIKELGAVASRWGFPLIGIDEYSRQNNISPLGEIEETGSTYRENALIKAQTCFKWCGKPSLGDDSGLEVEILGGAPGIFSARYAGVGASDSDKIKKLLSEIRSLESGDVSRSRKALFRSVLCLVASDSEAPVYFEGTLSGEVLDHPRGTRGFGYDPIIYIPELGGTLSEMMEEVVFEKGFRAKAAKELFQYLKDLKSGS
ncbi:MAG TPA: non-canonical purine NTP pyrophosphatase [Oligoflexia bacterium]|nr:non-canonical purine NTP pyrophosphatase [Oligoflexia bacterium]HMP47818.1 non-canonical purine NTP pyrophosphatase [Oligoflexia bacterium]